MQTPQISPFRRLGLPLEFPLEFIVFLLVCANIAGLRSWILINVISHLCSPAP
jgi:hypothetical protein